MSNPDRTQHALFFEIGRVSGKARQERISMKNSASLSASPSLSSPPLPYLREDKSSIFASITLPAVPPAVRPHDASLSETAFWVVSLLALYWARIVVKAKEAETRGEHSDPRGFHLLFISVSSSSSEPPQVLHLSSATHCLRREKGPLSNPLYAPS